METKRDITYHSTKIIGHEDETNLPGYPLYPAGEDIYNKLDEETEIDPEDISQLKSTNEKDEPREGTDKNFYDKEAGSDLDVPGNEADEKENNAGSEDEENNFYSLGGDDHNDLEEDNGGDPAGK
jgi:hypothetical protein